MKFRMTCPKCGSTNFSIERDNRSYAPRGQTFEMIFSCRCGKQMFGDQIVKEYDRQKKEFEAHQDAAQAEVDARPEAEDVRPAAPVAARGETLAEQARAESPAAGAAPADPLLDDELHGRDDEADDAASDVCGWHPCSNPPRPNSKYCSRDCSNKNARWRYKQRKAAEKEAA